MLFLVVVPVLAGVVVGYARGGRLRRLAEIPLRGVPLLVIAAGLPMVDHALTAVSFLLVGIWAVLNLRGQPGTMRAAVWLVVAGAAMNAVVIAANGRMPVAAPVAAGSAKHENAGATTSLAWLGDVLPVDALGAMISVGDVVLLLGVAAVAAVGMTRHHKNLAPAT